MEAVTDFIFLGPKITVDSDCNHEIKRCLLLGRKTITNLGSSLALAPKSCLTLATLWTVACQAPLFTGFSRLEYWSGFPCPPPWDLPDPGMELLSVVSPTLVGSSEPPGKPFYLLTFGDSSPL